MGAEDLLGAVAWVGDNEPDETFADPGVRAAAWSVAGALRARESGEMGEASVVER